jgi:hypothetical protein
VQARGRSELLMRWCHQYQNPTSRRHPFTVAALRSIEQEAQYQASLSRCWIPRGYTKSSPRNREEGPSWYLVWLAGKVLTNIAIVLNEQTASVALPTAHRDGNQLLFQLYHDFNPNPHSQTSGLEGHAAVLLLENGWSVASRQCSDRILHKRYSVMPPYYRCIRDMRNPASPLPASTPLRTGVPYVNVLTFDRIAVRSRSSLYCVVAYPWRTHPLPQPGAMASSSGWLVQLPAQTTRRAIATFTTCLSLILCFHLFASLSDSSNAAFGQKWRSEITLSSHRQRSLDDIRNATLGVSSQACESGFNTMVGRLRCLCPYLLHSVSRRG